MLEEKPSLDDTSDDASDPTEGSAGGAGGAAGAGIGAAPTALVTEAGGASIDEEPQVARQPLAMGGELRLMDCGISRLPLWVLESHAFLRGIKVLWLGKNRLAELPPGLCLMPRLEKLNAINNSIVTLTNVLPPSLQVSPRPLAAPRAPAHHQPLLRLLPHPPAPKMCARLTILRASTDP